MHDRRRNTHKANSVGHGAVRTAVVFGCLFFVVATGAAMFDYPGGTHLDPGTEGYDFFDNTFSELGRIEGYLGQEKRLSFVLFLAAMVVAGVALVAFFAVEASDAKAAGGGRIATKSAVVLGAVTGMGFAGIGLTPTDVIPRIHYFFVYAAFSAYVPATVALFAAWRTAAPADDSRRRIRLRTYGAFFVVLAVYLVFISVSATAEPRTVHLLLTSGQKIIVYVALGVVAFVSADDVRRRSYGGRAACAAAPGAPAESAPTRTSARGR